MALTRKGQATREHIVETAAVLIGQFGVAGTSTEDVRTAAGISGSQLYHYFDSKQALVRAVITRQAEMPSVAGEPIMGPLDSFDALQAWADAAAEHMENNGAHGRCSLAMLAGAVSPADDQTREHLCHAFLRWQSLIRGGLGAMRDRGDLRADADLDELSMALLTALQGGILLSRTLGTTLPLRASMRAALSYTRSFAA